MNRDLLCGAAGSTSGHPAAVLGCQSSSVRAVDIKPLNPCCQKFDNAGYFQLDLGENETCEKTAASSATLAAR